jgi:hypothetical protein
MVAGSLIILGVLFTPAYCQTSGVTLLIEQNPPQGGVITPGVGVHNFDINAEVTLTAIPKPGYQFIHWLGDVVDPTASTTVVYLNKPKIIIAVFEQTEYGFLLEAATVSTGSPSSFVGGGGYLPPSAGGGGGGYIPPGPPPKPPPIPEPATGLLLALGGLALLRKRSA